MNLKESEDLEGGQEGKNIATKIQSQNQPTKHKEAYNNINQMAFIDYFIQ